MAPKYGYKPQNDYYKPQNGYYQPPQYGLVSNYGAPQYEYGLVSNYGTPQYGGDYSYGKHIIYSIKLKKQFNRFEASFHVHHKTHQLKRSS